MRSKTARLALAGVYGLLVCACGPGAPATDSNTEGDEAPSETAAGSDFAPAAEVPDAESVVLEIRDQRYVLDEITQCPATPGFGLGFQAYSTDPNAPADLRAGGGFEQERAQVFVILEGARWKAGEGVEGSELQFEMTDHDTERGLGAFVTVSATGTLVDEQGSQLPFQVIATCAPGGT